MGRPKTRWAFARVALFELGRGSTIRDAARVAGLSEALVARLVNEYGVMPLSAPRTRDTALTIIEREEIMLGIERNETNAEIARRVGCHRGTIGREITRAGGRVTYRAHLAQDRTERHGRRNRPKWWETRPWLWNEVASRLIEEKWSPEQIARWLRREHPDEPASGMDRHARDPHDPDHLQILDPVCEPSPGQTSRSCTACPLVPASHPQGLGSRTRPAHDRRCERNDRALG